jgi:HEAT repeat protein
MVKMLRSFFDRSNAADALKRLGPERAETELQKVANDRDANVSAAAREILAEFKDGGPELARQLKNLSSPTREMRLLAAQEIGKMYANPRRRAEVARALEARLTDEDGNVAQAAANALARWGAAENEAALIKALEHRSADVRLAVVKALHEVGTPKSIAALEPLEQDKDKRVTGAAREAVTAIESRNSKTVGKP